jgi:hypothetical protein
MPTMGVRVAATLVVGLVVLTSGCTAGHVPDGRTSSVAVGTSTPGSTGAPDGASPGDGSPGATPAGTARTPGTAGSVVEGPPVTGPATGPLAARATPAPGATPVPHLTTPLPATASVRGSLVKGFPVAIVPVPAGATVVSSSVASDGSRLQVGLEATTAATPTDVRNYYVRALTAAGFAPSVAPADPGASATAFMRGNEGLVLTLRERMGGGTALSVAGTLVAGS